MINFEPIQSFVCLCQCPYLLYCCKDALGAATSAIAIARAGSTRISRRSKKSVVKQEAEAVVAKLEELPEVSCDWRTRGHVTPCSPLIGRRWTPCA